MSVVTQDETLKLLHQYRAITAEKIDRVKFCDLLHNTFGMTDDYFMDKGTSTLVLCLSESRAAVFKALDHDSDGFLNQEEWIKGLSIFLRGSLEEKMTCEHVPIASTLLSRTIDCFSTISYYRLFLYYLVL